MIQIWYPSEPGNPIEKARWMDNAEFYAPHRIKYGCD